MRSRAILRDSRGSQRPFSQHSCPDSVLSVPNRSAELPKSLREEHWGHQGWGLPDTELRRFRKQLAGPAAREAEPAATSSLALAGPSPPRRAPGAPPGFQSLRGARGPQDGARTSLRVPQPPSPGPTCTTPSPSRSSCRRSAALRPPPARPGARGSPPAARGFRLS